MVAVYGAAGVGVAALFWACFRDRPRQHPRVNAAEADLIEASASRAAGPARGLPLRAMLVSPSLWLISFSQFTTNFGWVFLVSWMPRYLEEVCGVTDVRTRGLLTSIPLAVAIPAMLAGGWTTDRLTRRVGLRWGRSLPWALTRFAAMAALLACLFTRSPWVTTAALAVMSMSVDLGVASVWAYKQDVGGKYVGSILGWGNMWGNFGAAVSPIALEWLFRGSGWDAAFLACASAFLLSGLSSLGVDARVPVVPREDTAPAPPPKTP